MERKYALHSKETLEMINTLMDRGITRMSVILRHSDRYYHEDARMEPFMGLTDQGKSWALDLGKQLPAGLAPALFSSHFGRCIETAYLIDKGFTRAHGLALDHNTPHDLLAPFYIKNFKKSLEMLSTSGTQAFIRNWFDNGIDKTVMADPGQTARKLTQFMVDRLRTLADGQAAVCISHDWNIFPIKTFTLGMDGDPDVGYLDGVIFYEAGNQTFAVTRGTDPVALT